MLYKAAHLHKVVAPDAQNAHVWVRRRHARLIRFGEVHAATPCQFPFAVRQYAQAPWMAADTALRIRLSILKGFLGDGRAVVWYQAGVALEMCLALPSRSSCLCTTTSGLMWLHQQKLQLDKVTQLSAAYRA